MTVARRCPNKSLVAGMGLLLALTATSLAAPAHADDGDVPVTVRTGRLVADCLKAMPMSAVKVGMTGEGLTVVRGNTPQPFAVEVLGVLKNGIGAGRDLILVEVSDVDGGHVIDQGGGIWAGMSGSPVYVDGQLLGAVSYGFTGSSSPIGGVTPAADMAKLFGMAGASSSAMTKADVQVRSSVTLSKAMRQQVDAQATAVTPRASLTRLPTPLAVSGLSSGRLAQLQRDADAARLSVVTYAGSSQKAPSVSAPVARPVAGGNFAAAISYGDVTLSGVGTTTAVCGNQAVAFGHPMTLAGPTTYGAHDATSLAIVRDDAWGSFKMAEIGTTFGILDQDRGAGIRARLGVAPTATPVVSTVRNLDSTTSRTGTTQVTDASWLPAVAPQAVLANLDSTFDELGGGSASSSWTITGTRAAGKPFSISRSNLWASAVDLTLDPAVEVGAALDQLVNNEFEPVKVQRVSFDSSVSTKFRQSRIADVAVSVNTGAFAKPARLNVKVGDTLRVRVSLQPYQSATLQTTIVSVKVPAKSNGMSGSLDVTGGLDVGGDDGDVSLSCLLTGEGCDTNESATSLNDVIKGVTSAPRNDDVVADLFLASDEVDQTVTATATKRHTSVVTGQRSIEVLVRP